MSISSFFSPLAKILIDSGYIKNQQMEQAIARFIDEGKPTNQNQNTTVSRQVKSSSDFQALAFIKNIETVTKRQLPFDLHRKVINYFCGFHPFTRKLIQSGYADLDQIQQASMETRKTGRSIVEILESLIGRKMPPELQRQYKKYQLFELKIIYGVEPLDLEITDISLHQVAQLIDTLIPIDICRRYRLVPISKTNDPPSVLMAMVDPDNLDAQDDLNRILRSQNIGWRRMAIPREDYQQLISKYLDLLLPRAKEEEVAKKFDIKNENWDSLTDRLDEFEPDLGEAISDAAGDPIINLVNKILAKALQERVSDIHIEPNQEFLRVRFRKDGVLRQAFDPLPKKTGEAVASRFKIMAKLDITQRQVPQNGRIQRMFNGSKIDFRVSILPSRYGEKVVLRILDISTTQLGLHLLITDQDTLEIVREMANRPSGLLLVTGAANSGKSTTLYSILAERNDPGVNISTIEDPIEYSLPGITQVQVVREKGLDFASILRCLLLQDVDIILVDKTGDKETAITVIEAALKGYFVLSTISGKNAATAIPNLKIMGIESFLIADALTGVIAQRLMRRVCSECRISYQPSAAELAKFGLSAFGQVNFYKANSLGYDQIQEAKVKQTLCQKCNGVGYRGRVGVYEVMRVTQRIKSLISKGADTQEIQKAAIEEGMTTLLSYSLKQVAQGYTTLEEVERVTFTQEALEIELMAKRQESRRGVSTPNSAKEIESSHPKKQLEILEKQLAQLTDEIQDIKSQMENSGATINYAQPLIYPELEDLW